MSFDLCIKADYFNMSFHSLFNHLVEQARWALICVWKLITSTWAFIHCLITWSSSHVILLFVSIAMQCSICVCEHNALLLLSLRSIWLSHLRADCFIACALRLLKSARSRKLCMRSMHSVSSSCSVSISFKLLIIFRLYCS